MTEPVTLSRRTWTITEQGQDKLPVHVTWTETIVLRDATDEERAAMKKARPKPG